MKFCKTVMAFFTLFSLYNTHLNGSVFSDLKKTARYIIFNPVQSAIRCGKIGIKAFGVVYPACLCVMNTVKCYEQIKDDNIYIKSTKSPLQTGTIAASLFFFAFACGSSLIDDIKELK